MLLLVNLNVIMIDECLIAHTARVLRLIFVPMEVNQVSSEAGGFQQFAADGTRRFGDLVRLVNPLVQFAIAPQVRDHGASFYWTGKADVRGNDLVLLVQMLGAIHVERLPLERIFALDLFRRVPRLGEGTQRAGEDHLSVGQLDERRYFGIVFDLFDQSIRFPGQGGLRTVISPTMAFRALFRDPRPTFITSDQFILTHVYRWLIVDLLIALCHIFVSSGPFSIIIIPSFGVFVVA